MLFEMLLIGKHICDWLLIAGSTTTGTGVAMAAAAARREEAGPVDEVGGGGGADTVGGADEDEDAEAAKKLHWSPSRQMLEELIKAELKVAPPGSSVKTAAGVSQV